MGKDKTAGPAGKSNRKPFLIGAEQVPPGKSATVRLPIGHLSTHMDLSLPVRVIHGASDGPVMFVTAAIHGDEIIGVEIIRRLLHHVSPRRLAGTLLCVPVVNFLGFIAHQRYLPDRRDLNRSFPGSSTGSLAAQLAHVLTNQVLLRSDVGIDLHSAGLHRTNLPQIRISDGDQGLLDLARAFGAPVIVASQVRDGSLRQETRRAGVPTLLYEAGEALRFDELAIRLGVKGILRVMAMLGMVTAIAGPPPANPVLSRRTRWTRAPEGGIFRAARKAGDLVEPGDVLGSLSDPFGDTNLRVTSDMAGIIIGRSNLPVVNQGDALMHIAEVRAFDEAEDRMHRITHGVLSDPLFDEDELI